MYQQKHLFEQALREDRATLKPIERSIERLEKERAEAEASKVAIEKQLVTTEARSRKAAALKKQHVVYEDGVYTEQLVGTLEQMMRSLRGQLTEQIQSTAKVTADLVAAREAFTQSKRQRVDKLSGELAWVRGELARSSIRMTTMAGQLSQVEVRSGWPGSVQQIFAPRDNGQVQSGEKLLTLRVPSEKAILEALIPSYERNRIRVGQPASVTFPYPGNDRPVEYAGMVRSVLPSQGQLAFVQIEIDTPREAGAFHEIAEGLRGEVVLRTREEALRQHLWDWLHRQAESFDDKALTMAIVNLIKRVRSTVSPMQHLNVDGQGQGP